jgi:translation initiation factor 2 subunit 3
MIVQRSGRSRHIRKLSNIELNSDIVKWFAFVWSEGSSSNGTIEVTQTVQLAMLSEYLRIAKALGLEVRSYPGGMYRINNTPFVDFLRFKFDFAPGNKYESPIAGWACRIPRNLKSLFLRWFLTLDGEFNPRSGQVSVSQGNEKNIVVIAYVLHSFGITPRFNSVKRKVKEGSRKYTRLSISGRRNLQLFAENIGFEDPVKQGALLDYLDRTSGKPAKESDLSIPIDIVALQHLVRRIGLCREAYSRHNMVPTMKGSSWYKAYEGAVRTGRVSRAKLLQLLQSIQDQLDRVDSSLTELSHHKERLEEHLELIHSSLESIASELGMSRKKFTRIMRHGTDAEKEAVSDVVCRKTLELLRETQPVVEQLRILASTPLEFDRIVSVDVQPYSGRVYDLTVPDHENFIAGNGAIVAHNTTTVQAITGVWASAHSEELRRGITIKVGYADAAFYKCPVTPPPAAYSTNKICPVCGSETQLLRAVSFVDCPGHESLMTNMLAGAFLMDGALLVIAANEPVPRPQTREHLQALQMLGMKKIVIAQNKVDLVGDSEARKNYEQIESFVSNTVAAQAPIIPISAQQRINTDALIEALEEVVPTPKRDVNADPLMYVVRSFDVNKPGMDIQELSGGVLGGSLVRGELRTGEEMELRPGMVDERSGKYVPVITRVSSLQTGAGVTDKVGPGGLVAVGTYLDPSYTKGDQMVGSVIGKPGTLPPSLEHLTLGVDLFETAVGSAELVKVEKVRPGENLRLNLGTASAPAVVTSARDNVIEVDLKKPVAVEAPMRAAISRRIAERWRLIGSGVLR